MRKDRNWIVDVPINVNASSTYTTTVRSSPDSDVEIDTIFFPSILDLVAYNPYNLAVISTTSIILTVSDNNAKIIDGIDLFGLYHQSSGSATYPSFMVPVSYIFKREQELIFTVINNTTWSIIFDIILKGTEIK